MFAWLISNALLLLFPPQNYVLNVKVLLNLLLKLKITTEIEFNNNRIQMTVMNVKCTTCIKSFFDWMKC